MAEILGSGEGRGRSGIGLGSGDGGSSSIGNTARVCLFIVFTLSLGRFDSERSESFSSDDCDAGFLADYVVC